jgi:phage tail sheath protein FI
MSMQMFAPDVYVIEEPSGARPIGAVGTSTAGFVGTAPDPTARAGEVVGVSNWMEFCSIFVPDEPEPEGTPLSNAVFGFFNNGGGRCYVVNIAEGASIEGAGRERSGLALLETIDEIAIVAAPGYCDLASYEALLGHCERLEDRVAILDPPPQVETVHDLTEVGTVTEVAGADGGTGRRGSRKPDPAAAGGEGGDAGAAGAAAEGDAGAAPATETSGGLRPRLSTYGAFYFPGILAVDPLTRKQIPMAPSGHLAGVWARTDLSRGVHKAPANEPIRGAVGLTYAVTRQEQEELNPKGVNCIRAFPAEGIKVWGARTLAAEADPFRYLNVRRLFNMLKESIAEGTRWTVFEPNDEELWSAIRRDVGAFLKRVWADGALLGRTPQEAFFVKCDAETNPAEVRDAGQVVTLIGVCPVKPAEFVLFKLSQSSDGSELQGG